MTNYQTLTSTYVSFSENIPYFLSDAPRLDDQVLLILDVVINADGDTQIIFPQFVNFDALSAELTMTSGGDSIKHQTNSYTRGNVVIVEGSPADMVLSYADKCIPLVASKNDIDQFSNTNAALLIWNGEDQKTIQDWVSFYIDQHALQSLVLVRRTAYKELSKAAANVLGQELTSRLEAFVLLDVDAPLGVDAPPEHCVFMAPDAPNKDRIDIPAHDPWSAPLASSQIHEIVRSRFLGSANTVLHATLSDLIPNRHDQTVFEAVTKSEEGYIQLYGSRVFPWRIRNGEKARFGDHICSRFENFDLNRAWIVSLKGPRASKPWNVYRVGAAGENTHPEFNFWRAMAVRHRDLVKHSPNLAPKAGLLPDESLIEFMTQHFPVNPVMPPVAKDAKPQAASNSGRRLIVTTMKNEGPFILEWIAYHKAIGFDDFIVYSNDCSDGTDTFLDLLHTKGVIEHRDNPYREVKLKPQHAALFDSKKSKLFKKADWKICMDCDEFIDIHVGDGTLNDLFKAIGDANMISLTWRLFGNSDVEKFDSRPVIEQFNDCAHEVTRSPHQAWGVKTLYRDLGYFKKMGVHRPKGLKPEHKDNINWVNGSGTPLPETFYRNSWRTGTATVGYDLVTLNHYACRSMESFLVKRDRGRVNHVDRDQGLAYWFRMNHNVVTDKSIHRHLPKLRDMMDVFLTDPEIKAQHEACIAAHEKRIAELFESENYQNFYAEINSPRMRDIAKINNRFGPNVHLQGPSVIPDTTIEQLKADPNGYFNVAPAETVHE